MALGVRVFAKPMRLSLSCSNGVIVRSLMVCYGLQKCSATPDLSTDFSVIVLPGLLMSFKCHFISFYPIIFTDT